MESLELERILKGALNISEIQAFVLDQKTSNFYMVFRGQQRILVCSSDAKNAVTVENRCVELFGNEVAANVGGLAFGNGLALACHTRFYALSNILKTYRTIYWTENDEEGLAVMSGRVYSSGHATLMDRGLRNPTSITVTTGITYKEPPMFR